MGSAFSGSTFAVLMTASDVFWANAAGDPMIQKIAHLFYRLTGSLSPFNAWVLSKSLEILSLSV
jgi:hypothetical protein